MKANAVSLTAVWISPSVAPAASAQVLMTHSAALDTLGRLLSSIGAANQITDYQYDNDGNLAKLIDPRTAATQNAFDHLNRLIKITDALNGLTTLTRDLQDNVTVVTDPKAQATTNTYNGFGEITKVVSLDSGTTTYTRDAGGNITSKKDNKRRHELHLRRSEPCDDAYLSLRCGRECHVHLTIKQRAATPKSES